MVLDFGTLVEGYPSDQTRTLLFAGDPPEGFVEVHDVVREAQAAGVAAVEPARPPARSVVEAAGYGDAFVHRTGHGVGLEIHQEPYVAAGSDVELEPGMVFSVEPGIYLDGRFGVRIEDLVAVTDDGAERLNTTVAAGTHAPSGRQSVPFAPSARSYRAIRPVELSVPTSTGRLPADPPRVDGSPTPGVVTREPQWNERRETRTGTADG